MTHHATVGTYWRGYGKTEDDKRRQMVSKRYKNRAGKYNQVSDMRKRKVQTRSELDPIFTSHLKLN